MNISRITIENFNGVEKLDLSGLTSTTLLTGPNGVGKTTVLNALLFAFGFDVRDAGGVRIKNADLVGPCGDSAKVCVYFEHADRMIGIVAGAGGNERVMITDINGKHAAFLHAKGVSQTYAALYEFLGMDPRHIECALAPHGYLLGPELGAVLADLCSGGYCEEDLKAAAGVHWDALDGMDVFKKGYDDLEAAGKTAFGLRTELKKRLSDYRNEYKTLEAVECPTSPNGKLMTSSMVPVVEEALKTLQTQRDGLIAEIGRSEGSGDRRAVLEGDRDTAAQDVEEAQKVEAAAEKAYDESLKIFQTASQQAQKVRTARHNAELAYAQAKKKLEDLEGDLSPCPTCGHIMTADEAEAAIAIQHPVVQEAKKAMDAIDAGQAEAALAEFEKKNNKARDALHAAQSEAKAAVYRLTTIEKELANLPKSSPRNIEEIQNELETLEERIAVGEKKLEQLQAWCQKEKLKELITKYGDDISALDFAVTAFKDGEFLKSRLSASKDEFESRCNERLAPFGYDLMVAVEGKSVEVMLRKTGMSYVPVSRCSKAELVLAGYAVATAFDGCSPVCIDDLDAMYAKTKGVFLSQMKKWDRGRPLFASGAWTNANEDLTPIHRFMPGAKVYWIGRE